jgi:hypothetical protein
MTIIGAMSGGLMTQPTRQQMDAVRAGQRMTIAGAHTVGAPDGGAGVFGTGGSVEHGDLRVPHFLGLHAMQALPLFGALLARRRYSDRSRVRMTMTAAAAYGALFAILLTQALRGQSILAPDLTTITLLGVWAIGTAAAAAIALRLPRTRRTPVLSEVQ